MYFNKLFRERNREGKKIGVSVWFSLDSLILVKDITLFMSGGFKFCSSISFGDEEFSEESVLRYSACFL